MRRFSNVQILGGLVERYPMEDDTEEAYELAKPDETLTR